MKKLITGILATLTCLCCFTGCGLLGKNSSSSSVETVATIDEAAAYLDSMYKDHDTKYTDKDYEVVSSVTMEGVTYTVEWAVDVAEDVVKVVVGEDGKVTVDVNNLLEEDVAYKLTATLTAPDGETTKTVEFNRTVKANPIVPVAITKKPEEETAYKLYMYQVTKKADEYFNGTLDKQGFYLYTTMNQEYAVDVFVDYVDGSETDFNLYFFDVDNVKQYIGVYNSYNSKGYHLTANFNTEINNFEHITSAAGWEDNNDFFTGSYVFTWKADYETFVTTLANAKYDEDKNKAPADVTAETVTAFLGTDETHYTFGGMSVEELENEDTCVGKLVEMLDKRTVEPEQKVEDEKMFLKTEMTFSGDVEETLPTASRYNDVTITWELKEDNDTDADVTDGVLTMTAPEVEATITLTATIKCGEVTDTLDVTVTVFAIPEEITFAQATEIGLALSQGSYSAKKYYLTGTIVKIENTTYGNMYIANEAGETFYVYGVYDGNGKKYGEMANKPVVGDQVKLLSTIKNHYGKAQFSNADVVETTACTDKDKVTVEAYNLSIAKTISASGDVTVPVAGTTFTDVTIAWASDNAAAVVNGSTITYTQGSADVDVTLTATVTCGEATVTLEIPVTVCAIVVEDPIKENTAYKFYLDQKTNDKVYYFIGAKSGNFLSTSTNPAASVDVYAEKVIDGYNFYFMAGQTKTYISINSNNKADLVTSAPATFSYNNALRYWYVGDYYLGTYGTFETVGSSNVSYVSGTNEGNVDVTQFPARFVESSTITVTDANVVDYEASLIKVDTANVTEAKEIPLSTTPATTGVEITWALKEGTDASVATLSNNILSLVLPAEGTVSVTVVATVALNEASTTKEFTIKVTKPTAGALQIADLAGFTTGGTSYVAQTSTSGWTANASRADSQVQLNDSTLWVCSKTDTLTSPTLSGGISYLSFQYWFPFSNKKVTATITITDLEKNTKQTISLNSSNNAEKTSYTFTWDADTTTTPLAPITGKFKIEISNTTASQVAFGNIQWKA